MKPTKVYVNKNLDFKHPSSHRDPKIYLRLSNTLHHWIYNKSIRTPDRSKMALKNTEFRLSPIANAEVLVIKDEVRRL